MNFRHLARAVLLSVTIAATAACATQRAGTPMPVLTAASAGSPTVTRTVISTSVASTTVAADDTVTQRWVTGMCADMSSVLAAAADVPDTDETAPLAQYRRAYVEYYSRLSAVAQRALDGARAGRPPSVTHGAEIHQRFITYLTGLQDVASSGAAVIAGESSPSNISADVGELGREMADLGNGDAGLGELSSPELAAAIDNAPACQELGR